MNKPEEIKQDSDKEKEIEDDLLAKQYNNSYKIITNNILINLFNFKNSFGPKSKKFNRKVRDKVKRLGH